MLSTFLLREPPLFLLRESPLFLFLAFSVTFWQLDILGVDNLRVRV